jgi:threonyl-tRNA synthetase
MKSKYLVINKKGNIYEPEEYLASEECSSDMNILIRREVLGEKWESESKSEYINIANKLGFSWEENSQIGFLNYNYKGNLIKRLVEGYARNLVNSIGFPIYEVKGSNFFDLKHPVVQSYAGLFGDRLFKSNGMVMSYDASYPQFNLASNMNLKESDFPFAHFSISDCYRNEQRGECMLLYRNRRFFMPDIHPYFKDVKQAWEWYPKIENQLKKSFKFAGREYINIAKISSKRNWELYKEEIIKLAVQNQKEILVDIKIGEEEKYWIVDIDYGIIDKFEQFREIGCIQIDVGNAKRLGIRYDNDKYPVIIHSAIPGGIERYIYMLIDNFKDFPIDFHPIQLRIIPVSEKYVDYALKLVKENSNIRIDIDDRAESVSKRIKMAHEESIPNILVVGEKEMNLQLGIFKEVRESLNKDIEFIQMNWPVLVSRRV